MCRVTTPALLFSQKKRAPRSCPSPALWEDIVCVQEDRLVGNDNTVRYKTLVLQIPQDKHRHHYVKTKVMVHEYPDGHLAIFHGPRCLAKYNADGTSNEETEKQAA